MNDTLKSKNRIMDAAFLWAEKREIAPTSAKEAWHSLGLAVAEELTCRQPAASEARAVPVVTMEGCDEYGPKLKWSRHWAEFRPGTQFFVAPPSAPAAEPSRREQDLAMAIRRIVSSARRNCEDGSNVLKLANQAWSMLVRLGLEGSPLRDEGIESDTPAAESAEPVIGIPAIAERRAAEVTAMEIADKDGRYLNAQGHQQAIDAIDFCVSTFTAATADAQGDERAASVGKERMEFEKWARTQPDHIVKDLGRRPDSNRYGHATAEVAWTVWQARASLSAAKPGNTK